MKQRSQSDLHKLAELAGIQTTYLATDGESRTASSESLRQLLRVLGISAGSKSEVSDALEQIRREKNSRLAEPVQVCWHGMASSIELHLPVRSGNIGISLEMEDGETISVGKEKLRELRTGSSKLRTRCSLALPKLPAGFHHLRVEAGSELSDTLLLSAPTLFYAPPQGLRQWGIFAPMYAVHSAESWGGGNFTDWRRLTEWVANLGGKVMGALPVLSAFLDYPVVEPSPYSPASRLFWNEFYIDVTAVPGFAECPEAQRMVNSPAFKRKLSTVRQSDFVNYAEQMKLRRQVLQVLAKRFMARSGRTKLDEFMKTRPELEDYAAFRAACEQRKGSWHTWPEAQRSGKLTRSDYKGEIKNYYLFIQWAAQQQMDSLLETCHARDVRFYLDLPLGVNPDSYDAWRFKDFLAQGASAGAPPDSYFTKGQDWGFAPLHPRRCRELHYKYVIDYLRFQMRHTGMLRIDHVMALHRLYWIPHGLPARDGAYVRYPADELYAILSIESNRFKTLLIGENLGTVPPEVNKAMDRHGFRRMYVLQYEQQPGAPLPVPASPVAASVNTHDMPPFVAHWEGEDILDRADLGLLPKNSVGKEKKNRQRLRKELTQFLRQKDFILSSKPGALEVLHGALRFLAASKAETVLVTLEDLWLENRPQNTPGTSTERQNWSRKARFTIEEIVESPELQETLRELNELRTVRKKARQAG